MSEQTQVAATVARYGRASLLAATATIVLLEVPTWFFLPTVYGLLVIVLPALLVVLAVGATCAACGGITAQVGRGMMIGSIAAPLTLLLLGGGYTLAVFTGLIN